MLRDAVEANSLWGVAHGTYQDVPWNVDSPRHKFICSFIRKEYERAHMAGLKGVVVHLGAPPPEVVASCVPNIIPFKSCGVDINQLRVALPPGASAPLSAESARRMPPRIYLETPHIRPEKSHYDTPEKLAALFRLIRERVDPHLRVVGLCIDTAHIWSCGVDIQSYESADGWLKRLRAVHDVIPPEAIFFHLNDELHGPGSGRDEHEPLMHGTIWRDYRQVPARSGLAAFLEYASEFNIPTILERKARKAREATEHSPATAPMTLEEALASDYEFIQELGH